MASLPVSTIAPLRAERGARAMGSVCSWCDIPGWEGKFQINLAGEVRSVPRTFETIRKGKRGAKTCHVKGAVLRPRFLDGRKWVQLQSREKGGFHSVSTLMMLTFIGPRPEGMEVCHNDGNRANDALHNLRYDTKLANAADRKLHGTHYVGSKTTNSTLTESDILPIRGALAAGESQRSIARRYGLKTSKAIHQIQHGITWRHVT